MKLHVIPGSDMLHNCPVSLDRDTTTLSVTDGLVVCLEFGFGKKENKGNGGKAAKRSVPLRFCFYAQDQSKILSFFGQEAQSKSNLLFPHIAHIL